jgi:uncharacterized membrane protein YccC
MQCLRDELTLHGDTAEYVARLALVLLTSTAIYRYFHVRNGYWIPMTALLVLKPGLTDTVSRAIARMLGTMCGAMAVSFALAHLQPVPLVLAGFTVLFAWLAFGLVNVNYALFSMAITGYIVFLLSLNEIPGPVLAQRRTFCTALGGAIALCVRFTVIFSERRHWLRALATLRNATLRLGADLKRTG